MAELIDPTEIMFTAFEPKVANRFIMYIEGIPAYLVKASGRPSITFGDVVLDHINVERKLKGKGTEGGRERGAEVVVGRAAVGVVSSHRPCLCMWT